MRIGVSGGGCYNEMAGAANDAEAPKICRFIICSRAAFWEGMWKKTSSPFAFFAISESISEPKVPRCSSGAKKRPFTTT
jgi:hypothetical protein